MFDFVGLGESPPATITPDQLSAYLLDLRKKKLAHKTIADRVIIIKRFFGFLLQEGYLNADPSRRIPHPKVGQRLPKALSVAEIKNLFAAFDATTREGKRDQVFFQLAYAGGLRVSELTHVRLDDIDWNDSSLRVIGKGDRERRVYLKPEVLQTLKQYVAEFAIKDWLFVGRKGKPVTLRNMDMRFEIYVEKAGLPVWTTPHSLRHSIAVHYLMAGAPISFVQQLLGHEKLTTTGIYTQLTDPMMREIALRIPTALDIEEIPKREIKDRQAAYQVDLQYWDNFVGYLLEYAK